MNVVLGFLGVFALAAVVFVGGGVADEPATVSAIELDRYVGTWYAIAHIPTFFERQCIAGTTATYMLLENGQIRVENACATASGETSTAIGRAWIPNTSNPGRLKVSFVRLCGLWLFPGDYWILDIADDYSVALVGHPRQRFAWILSRTPTVADAVLDWSFGRFEEAGYSRFDFELIDQTEYPTP